MVSNLSNGEAKLSGLDAATFSQRVYIVLTATRGLDLPRFGGRVAGLGSGYLI
jgi:hypothetical protein